MDRPNARKLYYSRRLVSAMGHSWEEIYANMDQENNFPTGKYVFVPLGALFAKLFLPTRITPNQISWIWGFMMVFASLFLVLNEWWINILVGIVWICAYSMDYTDGCVARIKKIYSKRGMFLDYINHTVSYFVLFTCAGIGVARTGGCPYFDILPDYTYLILGMTAALGIVLILLMPTLSRRANPDDDIGNSDDLEGRSFGSARAFYIFMSVNPLTFTNMMFLIVWFALFDQMWLFVLGYGIGYLMGSIERFVRLYQRLPARVTIPSEPHEDAESDENEKE